MTVKASAASKSSRCIEDVYDIDNNVIASGTFSNIHTAKNRRTGKVFACKFTPAGPEDEPSNSNLPTAIMELEILKRLGEHASILTLVDGFVSPNGVHLITDFMKGSDLFSALDDRGSYAEEDARDIITQLLTALKYCHERGVVHRDVKLENILLPSAFDQAKIKLGDFGLGTFCTATQDTLTERCGTPLYVAPEVLSGHAVSYGSKVDVWSTGVVLFMLLSGYPPFTGHTMVELMTDIAGRELLFNDPAWELIAPGAKHLVWQLLTKDPAKRPSAAEALQHPWLQNATR